MSKTARSPTTVETPRWRLGAGRLKGQTGYDYVATGRGTMAGVSVLWGTSIAAPAAPDVRRFKVMIGSEVLWRHRANGGNAYTAATEIIETIRGDLWSVVPLWENVAVRRLDVCIDHWGCHWSQRDLLRFACRQRVRGIVEENEVAPKEVSTFHGPVSATYQVGARGSASRMLRVYNKIAEAQAKGKLPWMEPIWRQHGWDGKATVWRAEIEHGGEWLSQHGMTDVSRLRGCEHALWLEYLGNVRHVTGNRTRLKRAPTSAVWTTFGKVVAAAAAAPESERATWVWTPRAANNDGDMETLTAMAAGCIRKIQGAMFNGGDESERRAALWEFMDDALRQSEERAQRRAAQLAMLNRTRPPPRTRMGNTP